jgi:hypothetical protein
VLYSPYKPENWKMLEIIGSSEFKKIVDEVGGYDTLQTGTTNFFS